VSSSSGKRSCAVCLNLIQVARGPHCFCVPYTGRRHTFNYIAWVISTPLILKYKIF
jgi:hypothetical protein